MSIVQSGSFNFFKVKYNYFLIILFKGYINIWIKKLGVLLENEEVWEIGDSLEWAIRDSKEPLNKLDVKGQEGISKNAFY